jgi:hypothetical protein
MPQFNSGFIEFPRTCSRKPRAIRVGGVPVLRIVALLMALGGCAPALNWREVIPEGAALRLLFPCKPDASAREVWLEGAVLSLRMASCEAGGHVFALAYAPSPPGMATGGLLAALRRATQGNVGSAASAIQVDWRLARMDPEPAAGRVHWRGIRPDGRPLHMEAAYFSKGEWVYQASIVGEAHDPDGAEMFFGNLHLTP